VLSDEIKERLDPLFAEHDWISSFALSMPPDVVAALRDEYPPVHHPVVRVHPETGRRSLFVNMIFTQRIVGVSPDESTELLRMLYRHVQRPEFHCRLRWQPNTVAMWDNRAVQHYAVSDYHPARRVMDRISIVGDAPVGIGSQSTGSPHLPS
jgi:taurine dioxygenase